MDKVLEPDRIRFRIEMLRDEIERSIDPLVKLDLVQLRLNLESLLDV